MWLAGGGAEGQLEPYDNSKTPTTCPSIYLMYYVLNLYDFTPIEFYIRKIFVKI